MAVIALGFSVFVNLLPQTPPADPPPPILRLAVAVAHSLWYGGDI